MQNKSFITISIALTIIIIVSLFYYFDFRVGSFGVGRVGRVEITLSIMSTNIFIDDSQKITTTKDNQKVVVTLPPRVHQIIVSKTGYYPWTKKIKVPSAGVVTLSPIFILQNPAGEYITTNDPQFVQIKNTITSAKLPTKENPKISKDGTTRIWVENNMIVAKVNEEVVTVLAPEPIIMSLDFYKDRSDTVVFAAGESVFVIETDPNKEQVQNIMPIYKGQNPRFVHNGNNSIYILNGTALMALII